MKLPSFLFGLLFSSLSIAQSTNHLEALQTFKTHYNNGDAVSAYGMMAPAMQEALGEENVVRIITTFRKELGNMRTIRFVRKENFREVYETQFENGVQNISIAVNKEGQLSGLRFEQAEQQSRPAHMYRNETVLSLPFKGKWFTVWGGDTKAQNYHVTYKAQQGAFDFLVLGDNNKTYERSGTRNEDYFAFGKPIFAVCDGEIINVITGVEDNKPGAMNPAQALGNSVTIKTANNEYIVYAHFEKGTIKVSEGQQVKRGQLLGRCGNSGNSSEAHLHLHIQDEPSLLTAVGVKCYFDRLLVNGEEKTDYSPVRLDRIAPMNE